jgi:DNA-directed RNA polymerase specialized sigma24 family protein
MDWPNIFIELTNPKTSTGRIIYSVIYRELHRFNLDRDLSANEILNEIFIRGHTKIQKGYIILNPEAWIKGVAYLYIREVSRKSKRLTSYDNFDSFHCPNSHSEDDIYRIDDIATLQQAMSLLSPLEQRILHEKIVEGRSWSEIREMIPDTDYAGKTDAAWRKLKERAISNLRKNFHEIQEQQSAKIIL